MDNGIRQPVDFLSTREVLDAERAEENYLVLHRLVTDLHDQQGMDGVTPILAPLFFGALVPGAGAARTLARDAKVSAVLHRRGRTGDSPGRFALDLGPPPKAAPRFVELVTRIRPLPVRSARSQEIPTDPSAQPGGFPCRDPRHGTGTLRGCRAHLRGRGTVPGRVPKPP